MNPIDSLYRGVAQAGGYGLTPVEKKGTLPETTAGKTAVGRGADELSLSPAAKEMLSRLPYAAATSDVAARESPGDSQKNQAADEAADDAAETSPLSPKGASDLTPEEQEQVKKLADRDREVRTHEQAHVAAAGPYALGGPTYSYQEGPDGRNYAVGGEVQIDTSPVSGDPEATIRKARVVKAAALAPAEPSSQDHAVAAAATQMEMQARAEKSQAQFDESSPEDANSVEQGGVELDRRRGNSLDLVA
ncbi:putative metalloprotease CJM1_0395 family protein [Planctomycetaceae bacterium SH139]